MPVDRTPLPAIAVAAAALVTAGSAAAAPEPVITAIAVEGTAPFTVHVHGLATGLEAGSPLTARYAWDFGDDGADFDRLVGFNAGHVYDAPGAYTVTLTVTDETGAAAAATLAVTVLPDDRPRVHVAADGDDGADGATPATAVRTLARAAQLTTDGTVVLLRRGDVFDTASSVTITDSDVRWGAWGEGPRPVLRWTGGTGYAGIIELYGNDTADVTIEDLVFDSIHAPGAAFNVVNGVYPDGWNVTVRRCHFRNVSYAVNANRSPSGLLTQDNTAEVLGAYFVWGQGTDHVHLGNVVDGSLLQHDMRFNAERVLVAGNTLTNTIKSTVWFQTGAWAYLHGNTLLEGPAQVGPIPQVGPAAARWEWAVFEANHVVHDGLRVFHGAEHVALRNNVVQRTNDTAIEVMGWDETFQRTAADVRVLHNTGVNEGPSGRFLHVGADTVGLRVANNLYCAPALATGSGPVANVYMLDDALGSAEFTGNLWQVPAVTGWGNGWHYLWPYWSNADGYRAEAEWAALAGTDDEMYRLFAAGDLDGDFTPQFDAVLAPAAGVHDDIDGNPRSLAGLVTPGAVETGTGGTNADPDPEPDPDPDNDPDQSPVVAWTDDFEADLGWFTEGGGGAYSTGQWQRGAPAGGGITGDPLADADGSGQCWITGIAPGVEVSGAPVKLVSPRLDMTEGTNPWLEFALWFSAMAADPDGGPMSGPLGGQGEGGLFWPALLTVELSDDDGINWIPADLVAVPTGGWSQRCLTIADHVELTETVRMRVVVADAVPGAIVEAGLDDVRLVFGGGAPEAGPFSDDFEEDLGWTFEHVDVQDGHWERGVPAGNGIYGDPVSDFDGSGRCYLTANRPGESDVDGGPTRLISPPLDTLAADGAVISYAYRLSILSPAGAGGPENDPPARFAVRVTADGVNWITVEEIESSTNGWQHGSFLVAEHVAPSTETQVRFGVADLGTPDIVEAAVDDVRLRFGGYGADIDGNGLIDVDDLVAIILSWGSCPGAGTVCPADLNGDGEVNVVDYMLLLISWT